MTKLNPNCQLDKASAEIVQETLLALIKSSNTAKDRVRVKRASYVGMNDKELDKNMGYLSGLHDAAYAILEVLALDPPAHDGLMCDEYLINDEITKIALSRLVNI